MSRRAHIAYVVNVDWFFLSHRLPIARAARDAGYRISVLAADTGSADAIRAEGFAFEALPISRSGTKPLQELRTIGRLVARYRGLAPDLVHQVTIKPILYGSLAAALAGGLRTVNAISGLGYTFTGSGGNPDARRAVIRRVYHAALSRSGAITIFQNGDDRREFIEAGVVPAAQTVVIRGSGVDCDRFRPAPEPDGVPVVMLPARMLRDKGVELFVAAAHTLRERGVAARFVLVGAPDPDNPASIPAGRLEAWSAEGVVEWWGHEEDMAATLRRAHVVVLPSRREGLPKVLLEAAATARPIVATDVPGCREVVRHERTGLLVSAGDAGELAGAIERLVQDPALRLDLGRAGRALVETELSEQHVIDQTLALYRAILYAPAVQADLPPQTPA